MPAFTDDATGARAGVRNPAGKEPAGGRAVAAPRSLWGLYERGQCQARFLGLFSLSSFIILLFDLKSPFFRPEPGVCGARRAKTAMPVDRRINLTFRRMIQSQ